VRIAARMLGRPGPPGPAARLHALARSGRCARPCTASGSARISPTVMRGFSEAYGSWKMICIWRRSAAQRRVAAARSWPSKRTVPAVGSISAAPAGPGRLAAAGFAHQPSVSPRADVEADAVDRTAHGALQDQAALTGKCLTRPSTSAAAAPCADMRPVPCSCSAPPAFDRRLPAGHLMAGHRSSRSGGWLRRGRRASAKGQRGAKRQPGRLVVAGWAPSPRWWTGVRGRPSRRGIEPSRPIV
jgi:hypothetical protein